MKHQPPSPGVHRAGESDREEGAATFDGEPTLLHRAKDVARRRALLARPTLEGLSREAAEELLHDLQVHQIELELQNTQLRSTEQALATSRERYFRLYDLAPVGYLTLDGDDRIVEANLTAAALLGLDRATLVQAPLARFIAAVDQDRYYLTRRGSRGQPAGFSCDLRLTTGDEQLRWIRIDVRPVPDGTLGDAACWATLTDITESRRLGDEVEHARKMAAIGTLASGVAHEFNNMLAVILGHAELVAAALPPTDPIASDIAAIATAARRSRDVARQLLAFGRRQALSPMTVDLRATARDLERIMQTQLRPDTELRFELADLVGSPFVDPAQLEHLLVNLAINARDAMPEGGELVIRADDVEVGAGDRARGEPLAPGAYVRLRVTDTGCGIPADVVAHVFEPFFTTKPFGQGTGLGLALVHGIVAQSGGRIDVESQAGRGTTFTILLPRAPAPASSPTPSLPAPEPVARRFSGRVLLVEDEHLLRGVVRRMLSRLGFEVDDAPSGAQALVLFSADPDRYRFVATDVSMPGMDGPTLVRHLAERRPQLKVLLMTGYLEGSEAPEASLDRGHHLLRKPFGAHELTTAIAKLLSVEA
ncbi:MAG: response regulator [Deltaproteobacteria bacterium]|nr:response regulator [Deltaproteobacteria bacterium]